VKKLQTQDFFKLHQEIKVLEKKLAISPGEVSKILVDPIWHRLWRSSEVSLLSSLNAPDWLATGAGWHAPEKVIPGIPLPPPE
jgi:hypothetical protein